MISTPPLRARPTRTPVRGRRGFTLIEHAIVVLILGVLAAISVPNLTHHHRPAYRRACFANQKTLAGAREMYILDKNIGLNDPLPYTPELLDTFVQEGYLQSVPQDPGAGPGTAGNYVSVPDAPDGIACIRHGLIRPPDSLRDASAYDQLRGLGVTDAALLERASRNPDPDEERELRHRVRQFWSRHSLDLLFILAQIAFVTLILRIVWGVGRRVAGVTGRETRGPDGPPCSICQQPIPQESGGEPPCSRCGRHHHRGCQEHVGPCDMFV